MRELLTLTHCDGRRRHAFVLFGKKLPSLVKGWAMDSAGSKKR
jgi:hypothetical protein